MKRDLYTIMEKMKNMLIFLLFFSSSTVFAGTFFLSVSLCLSLVRVCCIAMVCRCHGNRRTKRANMFWSCGLKIQTDATWYNIRLLLSTRRKFSQTHSQKIGSKDVIGKPTFSLFLSLSPSPSSFSTLFSNVIELNSSTHILFTISIHTSIIRGTTWPL